MNSDEIVDSYYSKFYTSVHGRGALGEANSVMHRMMEEKHYKKSFPVTLELGAGNFQHFRHVGHHFERYIATDIRNPPDAETFRAIQNATGQVGLEFVRADATALPVPSRTVDRVVATCLLVHLPDPISAVLEWQRVCKSNGVIDILVPCDPGLTLRLFRRIVSERVAKSVGVSRSHYRLVNAIEHMSSFPRTLTMIRSAIEADRKLTVTYFPFKLLKSWNLNAFAVVSIVPTSR